MTQEEKAKAYDKAVKVAQRFYDNSVAITKKGLEDIFPELKKSEDERIRKDIISYIQVANQFIPQFQKDKWIAWLEKQSEQKPADKVEPKFKVGQTIIYKGTENIAPTKMTISYIVKGQYWDDNCCIVPISDQDNWELVEQKPAEWSEEDREMIDLLIAIFRVSYPDGVYKANPIDTTDMKSVSSSEIIDWLKSLKDRVQPQTTWKPSEEQIEALDFAADCIVPAEFNFKRKELKGLLEQLKKLCV